MYQLCRARSLVMTHRRWRNARASLHCGALSLERAIRLNDNQKFTLNSDDRLMTDDDNGFE